MATCTFLSVDLEPLHPPQHMILNQIKHAEKKMFPRSEALDFDLELKKRNTELVVVLDMVTPSQAPALVAYAVYGHTSTLSSLHKLVVLERYRCRGIARGILLFQHQNLALRGCRNVQLWVDEERLPARRLYGNVGFEEVGRLENYYGPARTAWKMLLQL